MNSQDERVVTDIPKSVDSQIFPFNSDQFKSPSSSSLPNFHDNYLRENIGEPLSSALTYVLIYRPDDAIEFIANFLIDWSRKKTCSILLDPEINNELISSEQEKFQTKDLLIQHKEKQQQEIIFQFDKHLITSYQWDFHIDPRTDDEREPFQQFDEQKQTIHQPFLPRNTQQYIHTHDTSTGFDDDDEIKTNRLCHDGNLSSFTYFSKLKEKMNKCNKS